MLEKENYKSFLPLELYNEIEDIYNSFCEIQKEASGIIHNTQVPNATAHLNDVLQSTEAATSKIIDSVTNIQMLTDSENISDEIKQKIADIVTEVYIACSFQDITGQRIKKVVSNFDALESKLTKIMQTVKTHINVTESPQPEKDNELMNGPQLTIDTPSQDEVDKLFSSNK